jgi:uncharacterized protein (TIGR03083 family)
VSLSPRYDGAPIIAIDGVAADQLAPLARQRRRLQATLESLEPEAWAVESRCTGWSVQDVVSHLAGVNRFWAASVRAGLAGAPTRFLAGFDPVTTPELLVAPTRAHPPSEVLAAFCSSNDELLELLEGLDDAGWAAMAETPPGDLPVRLLASHALWDAWVHERDVLVPLGRRAPVHDDEVAASLRYVCALVVATALLGGTELVGSLHVEADQPSTSFILEVDADVEVRDAPPDATFDALRGDASSLVEALSARASFPETPPACWDPPLRRFSAVFDTRQ